MTYNGYNQLNFVNILKYIAEIINSRSEYDYVVNDIGGTINYASEPHYNAVTWNDVDTKPTWSAILANSQLAFDWNVAQGQEDVEPAQWFLTLDPAVRADSATLANKVDKVTGKGLSTEDYTTTEKTKLAGIAASATANDTDANLKNRANHTGTQAASTITGLAAVATTGSYNDLSNKPTIPGARSFTNNASRSLTTSTGAAGFQVSATRDALVNYSVTINTSVSLSGNATGYVALEIAPTNSATAGDWVEVGRTPSGQSGTLVIGLVLNQVGGGQIGTTIPAGYYAKLRTVNTSGTPTYTYNSGQEVLL